jgi:hypothetical protein
MTRLATSLQRYFFAPCPPQQLGCCRVAFYLWLLLFYLPLVDTYHSQNVSAFADVAPVFWQPIFPFTFLRLPAPAHPWIDATVLAFRVSLLMACVGLLTRMSMWCALVLGCYVIGVPFSFGKLSHTGGVVVIALGIMALAHAGDAISLDAWRRRRAGRPIVEESGEYRWPIRFVWVLLATAYFVSAVSKVMNSGLGYLDPDTMASFLRQRSFAWYNQPLTNWGYPLADVPWLCSTIAAWTLIGEGFFWLTLFWRRARAILVPGLLLTHLGITGLIGPQFFQWLSLFIFFVPWYWLACRMSGGSAPAWTRQSDARGAVHS